MSTRQLVYAYGCGHPVSGWDHALEESERCAQLWDQLVEIERAIEHETLMRAESDDPRLVEIAREIATLTARLQDDADDRAARLLRRALYGERRERLKSWRKAHKDVVREFEERRQRSVKLARQQSDAWWPNYNRVLQSYEAGRAVARQFGRRLRRYDIERDDGVLAVQIQRTRTGLGAAPGEIQDGTVAALQIGSAVIRGRRSRRVQMRVDADGRLITLPVYWHRELPEGCRVKAAQLVWHRRAHRIVYRLCLTVSAPGASIAPAIPAVVGNVSFDWRANGALHVASVECLGERRSWSLSSAWMRRVEVLARQQRALDEALKAGRSRWGREDAWRSEFSERSYLVLFERLQLRWERMPEELRAWYRTTRVLWRSWTGLRAHVLGHRRECYRLMAREIVQRYPALALPALDLAAIAREERGEEANSWRHAAAIHTLRAEIVHQATKAGVPVIASARVVNASCDEKSSAWARRKAGKRERSRRLAQEADEHGD